MPLLTLKDIYYTIGEFPLLDHIQLEVDARERIALIGRNGEGKSTLLKILSESLQADQGSVIKSTDLKISRLAQELPTLDDTTVYEAIAQGVAQISELLIQYHQLIQQSENHDEKWFNQLQDLQQQIDFHNAWHIQKQIEQVIQIFELPAESKMSSLSGGWRRRVALAQALVQEPDILLLDEPTNHLDLAAIQWLENFLLNYPKTVIFITHDRALLRKIATRIIELDRGKLISYPADYDQYLERKEQQLKEEERHNALFDKKLSQEEAWIRQGIKARRTRNEGRVRALKALREERQLRRVKQDKPTFVTNEVEVTGKTVIQANHISFYYDEKKPIVQNFDFNIQRGDKVAIIGPNGTGKTTLIKLLIGLLNPTQGEVKQSPANQIAFFDQNRADLALEETLIANVVQGSDYIEIQGKKKHIIGYLGDFLFSPSKCLSFAKTLSGGEQNRLLLAKLFSKPANILVLDEPTNDLDIETLDVLENLLLNYPGTVLVISHDREFIDNIATHCISFEEKGHISVNVGGYSDWLSRQSTPKISAKVEKPSNKPILKSTPSKKLSFNEQRELSELPAIIEGLENQIQAIQKTVADPNFYAQTKSEVEKVMQSLKALEEQLAQAYARWEALEAQKN